MLDFIKTLFDSESFMPHGHCYQWNPEVLWLHIISDALITLAYLSIPLTLIYFVRKRGDLVFDWMFVCFAVFIVACGMTHALEIYVIWHPIYWLTGLVKAITAVASLGTAFLLVRLLPMALRIPSPSTLQRANTALAQEIEQRKAIEVEREKIYRMLVESSRQAGMAEIATAILHNVGNALNSINVSASMIDDQVRHTKAVGVGKLSAMLKEHQNDLSAFLANDTRGCQIPSYLENLTEVLAGEREKITGELTHLRKNIEHVKEIVAMQQSYARVAGVPEPVAVHELVEDALNVEGCSLLRPKTRVVRDYQSTPIIHTDKHKVMQILVNLVSNARHACDESGHDRENITVSISTVDDCVRIVVKDDGVGIAPENLTRIFTYGFTTRKKGHGFGLHSSALAARELHGSLVAESDGINQGARFILELPLNGKPAETPGVAALSA